MTWDRLRQDGRAGCPACYASFATELAAVLQRTQRGPQHTGKTPRAAARRRRRLVHLRARRDHQLELLQRRLQECISGERFEEAARLRDKIKIVSSTIVGE
jgi:protein arginine kinase activator